MLSVTVHSWVYLSITEACLPRGGKGAERWLEPLLGAAAGALSPLFEQCSWWLTGTETAQKVNLLCESQLQNHLDQLSWLERVSPNIYSRLKDIHLKEKLQAASRQSRQHFWTSRLSSHAVWEADSSSQVHEDSQLQKADGDKRYFHPYLNHSLFSQKVKIFYVYSADPMLDWYNPLLKMFKKLERWLSR